MLGLPADAVPPLLPHHRCVVCKQRATDDNDPVSSVRSSAQVVLVVCCSRLVVCVLEAAAMSCGSAQDLVVFSSLLFPFPPRQPSPSLGAGSRACVKGGQALLFFFFSPALFVVSVHLMTSARGAAAPDDQSKDERRAVSGTDRQEAPRAVTLVFMVLR